MMSAGDLDGDVYFVCWDQELISYLNVDLMHSHGKAFKLPSKVPKPKTENIADYFLFYL